MKKNWILKVFLGVLLRVPFMVVLPEVVVAKVSSGKFWRLLGTGEGRRSGAWRPYPSNDGLLLLVVLFLVLDLEDPLREPSTGDGSSTTGSREADRSALPRPLVRRASTATASRKVGSGRRSESFSDPLISSVGDIMPLFLSERWVR